MGSVVVTYRGSRWSLAPDRALTFGRAPSCDVRLPDQDEYLSRRAGSLHALTDCVLVRNTSTSKPFVLRPPAGEDRVVEPGAAITSLPYRQFEVLLAGRAGALVSLSVDARAVTSLPPAVTEPGSRAPRTVTDPIQLSPAQRRVLLALCAPMLTQQGPAASPASYAQIGERLGLSPQYVRNVIKSLRENLAGSGLPGLTPDDPSSAHDDFRWPLARWAVRSRWITAEDLAELPDV